MSADETNVMMVDAARGRPPELCRLAPLDAEQLAKYRRLQDEIAAIRAAGGMVDLPFDA